MVSRSVSRRVLQDYFEAVATPEPEQRDRAFQLISSYAELQYRLNGGSRCPVCHTHVRHVVPVFVVREDGREGRFPCLCQRCLQAEQATAKSVVMHLGDSKWEVAHRRKRPQKTQQRRPS
jgi:hypothetical protein